MLNQARTTVTGERRQEGFALILAILALMLLTFLGLTLATSTSQELQIATNYRWNQQALYNAEGGLEVGKALLRDVDWATILPSHRAGVVWTNVTGLTYGTGEANKRPSSDVCTNCTATLDSGGRAVRNFENAPCDVFGGRTGFGVVLNDGNAVYQYVSNAFGQSVNGAFTIWVRRKVEVTDGELKDVASNDVLVLTVEGIAPYTSQHATTAISQTNRAVKFIEFDLAREERENSICGTRSGQAGAGPEGANFGGCVDMKADRVAEGLGLTSGSLTGTDAQ